MSAFNRALLPPPRTFYERELGRLSHPSGGWARARCPIHVGDNPTAFSVNLDSGGFYCFNCGVKGGDLVAFVRLRYKMSFPDACKSLGCWRDAGFDDHELRRQQREREQRELLRLAEAEAARQNRIQARDRFHSLETVYDRAIAGHHWVLMSAMLDAVRAAEADYWQACGLEVHHER